MCVCVCQKELLGWTGHSQVTGGVEDELFPVIMVHPYEPAVYILEEQGSNLSHGLPDILQSSTGL